MRKLVVLFIAALLSFGTGACGGARKETTPSVTAVADAHNGKSTDTTPFSGSFRGDEDDDDEVRLETPEGAFDNDGDTDNDAKDNVDRSYHDGDDARFVHFGHAARAADRRAITALVERYYAAAAAGDGATACALTYSILAESLPQDYGSAPGPAYLRGAKTCAAVLSGLFKHLHANVSAPRTVTGVRVGRKRRLVILGSPILPESMAEVRPERGVWKMDSVLDVALR
jgi:hypothetical protein